VEKEIEETLALPVHILGDVKERIDTIQRGDEYSGGRLARNPRA
jgi:hypothetical protein